MLEAIMPPDLVQIGTKDGSRKLRFDHATFSRDGVASFDDFVVGDHVAARITGGTAEESRATRLEIRYRYRDGQVMALGRDALVTTGGEFKIDAQTLVHDVAQPRRTLPLTILRPGDRVGITARFDPVSGGFLARRIDIASSAR